MDYRYLFSFASAVQDREMCGIVRWQPLYADNSHITKSTVDFWVQVLQRGTPPQ